MRQDPFPYPARSARRRKFSHRTNWCTGVVKYEEHEINIRSEMIDLAAQPFSLRPGEFIERAIQDQHQGVSNPHGVESAFFDRWETRKVVSQVCFLVAIHIVISPRAINDNFMCLPKGGFRLPNLP